MKQDVAIAILEPWTVALLFLYQRINQVLNQFIAAKIKQ